MARGTGVYVPDKRWPPVAFQIVASNPNLFANVANLTSLKAVAPAGAGATAVMQNFSSPNDVGGGTFVWSTANHATDVTNDPGNGIFVPANADTTGATGAWIRQYSGPVNIAWWGGISDGATDNSNTLNKWAFWARARSAAGFGVDVIFPPGTFNFDMSVAFGFTWNIKQLHLLAYGVTFQNTYNQSIHGGNFGFEVGWPGSCAPLRDQGNNVKAWFIVTTNPGDTQVTTVTHGDAANMNVNDWVLIGSLDIQYFGYPPNMDQFDYVRVTSVNSSTGVIGIDRPLRWNHRSDFPDGPNGIISCGKARIWQLNTLGWSQGGTGLPNGGLVSFDVDHTYEGLTVNQAPTSTLTYFSINGKRMRFINYSGVGHSESTAIDVIHENSTFFLTGEPDKLVERIHYKDCTEYQTLPFQSSSINSVVFTNPTCLNGLTTGQAKRVLVDGGTIDGLGLAQSVNFGQNRSTILRNVHIRSMAQQQGILPSTGGPVAVTGDVSYANGIFKIAQTFAGQQGNWNVRPGTQIYIFPSNGCFPRDIGLGYVTSITEDVNFIYIATTFPFATMPAWVASPPTGIVLRGGVVRLEGCWGSDGAMLGSQATQAGRNSWDYFRYNWLGQTATSGSFFPGFMGIPQQVIIDVSQPCSVASCSINFVCFGLQTIADPSVTLGQWSITINISARGKRIITPDIWDGKLTGDSMTLNAVNINTLPNGLNGDVFWSVAGYTPNTLQPWQLPIIDATFQMDTGLYRKALPTVSDAGGGGPNTIVNIQGTFQ